MSKQIYEDEHWIIEELYHTSKNSQIRITCFDDNHFVDDLILTKRMFMDEDDLIDNVKEILY